MSEPEIWFRGPRAGILPLLQREPSGSRGHSRWSRLRSVAATALVLTLAAGACSDRGSAIAVVYRGDVSGYRPLIHVRLGGGAGAREMTAAFPSAARFTAVPTDGDLPLVVFLIASGGDTVARYTGAPIRLRKRTSYQVNVSVGSERPRSDRCTGSWVSSIIAAPPSLTAGGAPSAESLFVSVSAFDRQAEPPRCDD